MLSKKVGGKKKFSITAALKLLPYRVNIGAFEMVSTKTEYARIINFPSVCFAVSEVSLPLEFVVQLGY